MSSQKPIYVEQITEAKTYVAIVGRIVRCSPHVTVTDSGLSHWNFTLRGHDQSFLSASAFNLPKRFPGVAALEGKMVLVLKLQVVANKKEFLRFGALGGRFKDTTMITLLPEDDTIPNDVPPLMSAGDGVDMDDYIKRERSTSGTVVVSSPCKQVCPNKCRFPDSYVCGKTGEPHAILVCEFCGQAYDGDEPWCRVCRGHRHTQSTATQSPTPPPRPPSDDGMAPTAY